MSNGDYYKGDKKKKKKGDQKVIMGGGPVFVPPTVTPKGKVKDTF